MPVTISLFSLGGKHFVTPVQILKGHEVRSVDVNALVTSAGWAFRKGSLQVSYVGRRLELGGLVTLTDDLRSLVFEQELAEAKDFASSTLQGVWWLPSEHCSVTFAIVNTTTTPVSLRMQLDPQGTKRFVLGAHETRLIDLADESMIHRFRRGTAGGISIEHSGTPGALFATGFIEDPIVGYSNVVELSDPKTSKASRLDAAGLRIGSLNGHKLRQYAVLLNTGTTSARVRGQLCYTYRSGADEITPFADIYLRPNEVKELKLEEAVGHLPSKPDIVSVGAELSNDAAPGTVIGSIGSISEDSTQVFRAPLRDATIQSSSTGNYPWSIDELSSTDVYLKNVTDSDKRFTMYISSEGGTYVVGVKDIKAHQTLTFDIRNLRDAHILDSNGIPMPNSASHGQVHWSVQGRERKALIGRAEHSNLAAGTSTTSSCGVCCPDSFQSAFIIPGGLIGLAGDSTQLESFETDTDCYGSGLPLYYRNSSYDTWSCDNTSVASVDPTAVATAVGFGNTLIRDAFPTARYSPTPGDNCTENYFTAEADTSCDIYYPASSCTITVNFTGDKTPGPYPVGDALSFPTNREQTLGPKTYSDSWNYNVEIAGTVPDDVSTWSLNQYVSDLRIGNLPNGPTIYEPDSHSDNASSGFTQQSPGSQNFFWLDSPGNETGFQNLQLVQNFVSWARKADSICRVVWHHKLVVTGSNVIENSAGFGFISTRF